MDTYVREHRHTDRVDGGGGGYRYRRVKKGGKKYFGTECLTAPTNLDYPHSTKHRHIVTLMHAETHTQISHRHTCRTAKTSFMIALYYNTHINAIHGVCQVKQHYYYSSNS